MNLKSSDEIRIVLIGKTGVGKTAAANTILGENKFNSELSSSSVTKECDKARRNVNQHKVAVIDTPGLFDTKEENTVIDAKIKLCISLSAPGPHVFLVVVQLGRFTAEEKNTVEQIQKIFGEQASKYTMVLFTHGDKLKRGQKSIHEFVKDSPDLLNFIKATSGRYHVFNNDTHDPNQVNMLFEQIDQLVTVNGEENKKYYVRTNKEQGKSWNTRHFYIVAAATAAAAALLMYAAFTKTTTQSKIPECPLSAPSVPSDEIVTKVEADVTQSETFWEMLHSLFNKDNKKVYLIGLVPLFFIMKKLMKK
uniref:AIG1-type G domain-containing protein n=1 Tax=Sinocyclocheilus anshuiensis TaxID=1608454 RepID=A0A671KR94_9TELE